MVRRFADRLANFDPDDKSRHPLHAARLRDLSDLLSALPGMNLTANADLAAVARDLQWVVNHGMVAIKHTPGLRQEALRRADSAVVRLDNIARIEGLSPSKSAVEATRQADEMAGKLAGLTY